ncbi:hypothetical protein NUW58_g10072 [Xylaria curta]|uniref:Uncharacterized protein n=1 Tax=Xylaria curta TaxID=42375 RepID=A0ACC1MQ28_9PEZI|nr:hypothetical protein NUW58_g10072 [Xylaria curta]
MDKFPVVGHQMTHSLDSYITDSANSASALYSGHKSTVNAMGVYADSSPDPFDDPKVETIVEILRRVWDSAWGAVSTAQIADATPIALTGHSRSRYTFGALVDQALNSVTNYTWTNQKGPDVWFGGGAEQFYPGDGSYQGQDYYAKFAKAGYDISLNKTSLLQLGNSSKALGIFCRSNLPVWLDRNVYKKNLEAFSNDPLGKKAPALDLPGLKEMTLKAVDILHKRGGNKGFFLMSEGASIDKQMHALDYDRALGDLLELDDTVRATVAHLKALTASAACACPCNRCLCIDDRCLLDKLVLGRKKKSPDKTKPPLPGERKAFRKRIQLSNDNALEVPGLDVLSPENAVSPESVGKIFGIPADVIDQLRACDAFKSSQNWSLFRSPHTLVRRETVDLAKQMTDAIKKKETLRVVVTGNRGSGKSILGLQALATGFLNKWVVVNIPEGQELTTAATEYASIPNSEMFSQPVYTVKIMQAIHQTNQAVLSQHKVELDHMQLPISVTRNMTLAGLLTATKEPDFAWPVFQAFWKELLLPGPSTGPPPLS